MVDLLVVVEIAIIGIVFNVVSLKVDNDFIGLLLVDEN